MNIIFRTSYLLLYFIYYKLLNIVKKFLQDDFNCYIINTAIVRLDNFNLIHLYI